MSPMIGQMLLKEVMPRLRSVAHSFPKIGCEDDEEIIQDATRVAAKMMDSAEKAEAARVEQKRLADLAAAEKAKVTKATKDQPFVNSLGMKFVPVGAPGALFGVWVTRVKDFEPFVDATGYDAITDSSNGWDVREWCATWYKASMNDAKTLETFPFLKNDGGGQAARVLRGGSWSSDAVVLRSAFRESADPLARFNVNGFRVVLVGGGR